MRLDVKTLANGGMAARLEEEIKKLIANILDPNTAAKQKRSVTVKIVAAPNEARTSCTLDITVNSKLAPTHPLTTAILVGLNSGTGEIDALEPQQGNLFEGPAGLPEGVIDFTQRKEGNNA